MNKKIISIILLVIGILLISTGIILTKSNNTNNLSTNTKNTSNTSTNIDKVEEIINILYSNSSTESEMTKTINLELSDEEIPFGKDSFLKQTYNVNDKDYKKVQDEYSDKIEKYILNKFEYKITENNKDKNIIEVKFKSYNYYAFICDLYYLKAYLEQQSGVSVNLIEENYEEYSKYSYKALVKAMTIMYSYIDNYNNDEETTVKINYNEEDIESQYYNLFNSLIHKDEANTVDETKIKNILEKAINDGIVDKDNPLNINNVGA